MKTFKKNQVVYIKAKYVEPYDDGHVIDSPWLDDIFIDDEDVFSEIPETIVKEERPELSEEDKKLAKEYQTLWDKYFY